MLVLQDLKASLEGDVISIEDVFWRFDKSEYQLV